MTKPPFLLLSDSHRNASKWLDLNPLFAADPPRIITLPTDLAGLYTPRVFCVGKYWKHPNWNDFVQEFARRDATVQYPDEEPLEYPHVDW